MDLNKKTNMKVSTISSERGISQTKTLKFVAVLGLLAIISAGWMLKDKILAAFDPISVIATVAKVDLNETDGRTNVLILGSDKRVVGVESSRSVLTDTILVASIGKVDKDVVLISLPRDLWVKSPNGSSSKINAVYQDGGTEALESVIQDVLGIPIHYHLMVSFDLFKEVVNILGGVNVTVDNTFTDNRYPIEGKENAPESERYETITFNAGPQKMDGEAALKFVRSRYGNAPENTDFARSRRQQKIIMAIKERALSIQTLLSPTKLKDLYEVYATNTDTDIDFGTVNSFYLLSQQINFDRVVSIVLDERSSADEGGLLYAPVDKTLYNDQYVLLPQTGDYTQIHAFVQKYLFGGK